MDLQRPQGGTPSHRDHGLPLAEEANDVEMIVRLADGQARVGHRLRLQGRVFPATTLLVDTSVWSLAFRRDAPAKGPEVLALRAALEGAEAIVTTGLVLQELLQGFAGRRARKDIVQRFAAPPLLVPDRQDYIDAADLRNACRRAEIQIGTIDALLGQLCIRHELTLLTTDADFALAARHRPLRVWSPAR